MIEKFRRVRIVLLALVLGLSACAPKPEDTARGAPDVADAEQPQISADAAAGREKSSSCLACHGALGESDNELWPDLAGQSAAYLAKQLRDFRDGRRYDPWMSPMAIDLIDQDIEDIAAWYSSISGVSGGPDSVPPSASTCVACHSKNAIQSNPLWPSIAHQNERYLVKQLQDFRDGRRNDPVMAPLAMPLTDEDIVRVAAVYANP